MAAKLRIMLWNANGLLRHQEELQAVLINDDIDVCLISETHFTNQSFIKFRGYKVYHTLHPENAAKGGSAVVIKENILHHQELEYKTEELQATSVSITTKTFQFAIAAVYSPPKHTIKKHQYLQFLSKQGHRFIIGGDFNAKHTNWGSRLITTKGKELLEAIQESKCEYLSTGKPTYWPTDQNKVPDLIDFFIIKNISSKYLNIEEGWDMNSDHSPITMTLSDDIFKKVFNPTLTNKLTDWESFKIRLEEKINLAVPLKNETQLEEEAEIFVKNIQTAAWENSPILHARVAGNNYPKEIRQLIMEKRKLRRKWQLSRDPEDKTRLNNATQHLKREIRKIKDESMNTYLRNLKNDSSTDYSLWRATKKLKRPIIQDPPIKRPDGNWARSSNQKADIFASHLAQTFTPIEDQEGETTWEERCQEEESIRPTSPNEVYAEIKENMKSRKAPGFDLITGEVLKQLPRKALVKLTHLFNAAFRLRYVPRFWKVAEVIMVPKPGKPLHEITSYRPISLLPVIAKLFEKLLLKRLKPIIDAKALFPNHQFGFRNKHATIEQVHRITDIIEKTLEEKMICSAVFLDVSQAFDRVWHEGLNYKLRTYLPKQFSKILESYISERYFRVKQEDAYSELQLIKAGVPQGSVLGPILYLLYTCDIPQPENSTIATFADDTAILSVGRSNEEATEKLQLAVNSIYSWTVKWRIRLNETKSIHVNFTNKVCQQMPVNIKNTPVPYSNTAKYLGITLDAKLRWKAHVKKKDKNLK